MKAGLTSPALRGTQRLGADDLQHSPKAFVQAARRAAGGAARLRHARVRPGTGRPKPQLVADLGATYRSGALTDVHLAPEAVVEATGVGELVFDLCEMTAPNTAICLTGISSGTREISVGGDALNRSCPAEPDRKRGT